MKQPVRIAVTGPAGQIGYSILFRLASGAMLGPDQPVSLTLLERPNPTSSAALKGVMMELDERYPQYGFAAHKGYGVKRHIEAIRRYGVLPVHRRTFSPVREILEAEDSFSLEPDCAADGRP